MKHPDNRSQVHRSFRRSVRQLFASLLKRQNRCCLAEAQTIIELLREIEASIEIMAREMARQGKRESR
jgi:hypothetical protein